MAGFCAQRQTDALGAGWDAAVGRIYYRAVRHGGGVRCQNHLGLVEIHCTAVAEEKGDLCEGNRRRSQV